MVVQFHTGVMRAREFLPTEDDCIVMVPLIIPEEASVSAWHKNFPDTPTFLKLGSWAGYVMSGRTLLRFDSPKPLVCVIFSLAADSE